VTDHPLCEEPFPNVQSELPLTQLHSIPLYPIAGYQREEISTSRSAALLEEVVDRDEGTPQPALLRAELAVLSEFSAGQAFTSFLPAVGGVIRLEVEGGTVEAPLG